MKTGVGSWEIEQVGCCSLNPKLEKVVGREGVSRKSFYGSVASEFVKKNKRGEKIVKVDGVKPHSS